MKNSDRRTMLCNAVLLTGISLLLRTAGISYRARAVQMIGQESMGLYTLVQTVFLFAVTFSTAGLSTAVMRVVSENMSTDRPSRNAVPQALLYALTLGGLAGLVLYIGAQWLSAHFLADARAALALRILAPSLPVMSASAVLKGYFYARREAVMPAVSDALEQGVEMLVFLAVVQKIRDLSPEAGCAAIALGTTVSELVSCLYLAAACRRQRRRERKGTAPVLRRFLRIALPVSASACMGAGLRAAENALIPRGLEANGVSHARSLVLYGQVRGMALPLIFYPAAFLSCIGSILIPEIAGARAAGRERQQYGLIVRVIRYTLLWSFCVGGIMAVFAEELGLLVYRDTEIARILLILAPLTPFMYLDPVADGMLKGFDQQRAVLRYNLLDSGLRLVMVYLLIPRMGFPGFMLVMYVSNILNPWLSVRRLWHVTGLRPSVRKWICLPCLCACMAAVGGRLLSAAGLAGSVLGLIGCMGAYVVLYTALLVSFSVLGEDDMAFCRRIVGLFRAKPCKTS